MLRTDTFTFALLFTSRESAEGDYHEAMKTVTLKEAQSRDQLFDEAQAGSPVLLVREDQVAKLERVEPPEFGGDRQTLENMLLDAVRGPYADWAPQDLEDDETTLYAERAVHGARDLPRRLLQPPGSELD